MVRVLTRSDISDTFRTLRRAGLRTVARYLSPGVAFRAHSSHRRGVNWDSVERIQERIATMVTGNSEVGFLEHVVSHHLASGSGLRGVSLCSGQGHNELELARRASFAELTGFDISRTAVEGAVRLAHSSGAASVTFRRADASHLTFQERSLDFALCWHGLHHLRNPHSVLRDLSRALVPGGLLCLYEYVGPARFQWPAAQIGLANNALRALPERYRQRLGTGPVKRAVSCPGMLRMLVTDPSEAVGSTRIRPALAAHYRPLQEVELGLNLAHLVFHEIGCNFPRADSLATRLIDNTLAFEAENLRTHGLTSDFLFGVYTPR